ncbi:MAG: pentapeptide repeat-containing protein [Nitrosomonas sp.]|uniref:pentapeptide repeat-containing protein n=1 Tax=Nitrosomonas sp. TaxID=42353 RepID=UPI0032F03A77
MMGFFSKIFASANAVHNTVVDDVEAARQAQIKKIEALLDSVNSASQHVRNYYITFLLACFYIAMIVWSTTDLMLLKNTPVTMPLLNVNLPITGFYTFAPYFFLLLHFNLLLQFSLLADKVHRFDQAVIELPDSESRRYYYTRLFAFVFTQILSARHHSGLLRFLLMLMVWITAIWLPLGILIGLQVGFLPYHDEDILFWQRVAVTLDLLCLAVFWPIIRFISGRGIFWILKGIVAFAFYRWIYGRWIGLWFPFSIPKQSRFGKLLHYYETENSGKPPIEGVLAAVATLALVTVFSWGIAVLPDSAHEKYVRDWLQANSASDWWQSRCKSGETSQHYFIVTEWLFDGYYESTEEDEILNKPCKQRYKTNTLHRNLVLREQLLIANELKAEDEADLKSSDKTIRQAALKKVTGLVLSGRDLRYADFSEARMPKADLIGANKIASDLRYANLERAMLIKVRMDKVLLQGAGLTQVEFQGAELNGAQFQGAKLDKAQFQGAKLAKAEFQGAELAGAQFQGARLFENQFQGAKLNRAQFQGTKLFEVQFQGANLYEAQFQGAELSLAKFQGANLMLTEFQGANLHEAQFQGAELSLAKFQGANLKESNFTLAGISNAQFGFLTQEAISTVTAKVSETILDEALHQSITDQLRANIRSQKNVFAAAGDNIWDPHLMRMGLFGFWNGLKAGSDLTDYQNKLAGYLVELSCEDRWVARGIISHRNFSSTVTRDIARCLLSLKDHKNQAGQFVCPAMLEIDNGILGYLKLLKHFQEAAAKKNPDATITPAFSCRTKRSDPVSAAN